MRVQVFQLSLQGVTLEQFVQVRRHFDAELFFEEDSMCFKVDLPNYSHLTYYVECGSLNILCQDSANVETYKTAIFFALGIKLP